MQSWLSKGQWGETRTSSCEFRSNFNLLRRNFIQMNKLKSAVEGHRAESFICSLLLSSAREFQSSMHCQTAAWKPTKTEQSDEMCSVNEMRRKKYFRTSKKLHCELSQSFQFEFFLQQQKCFVLRYFLNSPKSNRQRFLKCSSQSWTSFRKVYRESRGKPENSFTCNVQPRVCSSHLRSVKIRRVVCGCFNLSFCGWESIDCTSRGRSNTMCWRWWRLKIQMKIEMKSFFAKQSKSITV